MGQVYHINRHPTEALKDALKAWRDYASRRYALNANDRRDMVIRHTLVLLGVDF